MRGFSILAGAALALVPLAAGANDRDPAAMSQPAQAIDPARLQAAQRTVDLIFPEGTYARMMKESLDAVLGPVFESVGSLPVHELARMTGMAPDSLTELGDGKVSEVMAIYDPVFRQRMEGGMRAMMDRMTVIMGKIEPDIRVGLTRAYASRFDAAQLGELNRFFATPTGKLYAEQSMMIFLDPEVMQTMQKLMPVMIQEMPAIEAAAKAATANLPPPRSTCDLSAAEKARVMKLLGLKELPEDACTPPAGDTAGT